MVTLMLVSHYVLIFPQSNSLCHSASNQSLHTRPSSRLSRHTFNIQYIRGDLIGSYHSKLNYVAQCFVASISDAIMRISWPSAAKWQQLLPVACQELNYCHLLLNNCIARYTIFPPCPTSLLTALCLPLCPAKLSWFMLTSVRVCNYSM